MSDQHHRQVLEVVVNDTAARKSVDDLLARLQKAQDMAAGVVVGDGASSAGTTRGGATSSTARGDGGSGGGRPTDNAPSTGGGGKERDGTAGGGTTNTAGGTPASTADRKEQRESAAAARREESEADRKARERRQAAMDVGGAATGALRDPSPAGPFHAVGAAAGALGIPIVGGAMALVGAAMAQRYQQAMTLAGLERSQEIGRGSGVNLGLGGDAVELGVQGGFAPTESIPLLANYVRGIGMRQATGALSPFRAINSGISADAMAAFQATAGRGGGSTTGMEGTSRALGLAMGTAQNQFGMRGSKVDELLQRMTAGITQMAEEGLHLNPEAVLSLASQLDNNHESFAGMGGVRGALQLSQIGVGASKSFASNFAGLSETAVMAEAFGQTDDPLKAMEIMQRMSADPRKVRKAIVGQLGPEAAGLAFAGSGFSAEQAGDLARPLKGGATLTADMPSGEGGRLSKARGRSERRLLGAAAETPELSEHMIKFAEEIQGFLSRISNNSDAVMEKLVWIAAHLP